MCIIPYLLNSPMKDWPRLCFLLVAQQLYSLMMFIVHIEHHILERTFSLHVRIIIIIMVACRDNQIFRLDWNFYPSIKSFLSIYWVFPKDLVYLVYAVYTVYIACTNYVSGKWNWQTNLNSEDSILLLLYYQSLFHITITIQDQFLGETQAFWKQDFDIWTPSCEAVFGLR